MGMGQSALEKRKKKELDAKKGSTNITDLLEVANKTGTMLPVEALKELHATAPAPTGKNEQVDAIVKTLAAKGFTVAPEALKNMNADQLAALAEQGPALNPRELIKAGLPVTGPEDAERPTSVAEASPTPASSVASEPAPPAPAPQPTVSPPAGAFGNTSYASEPTAVVEASSSAGTGAPSASVPGSSPVPGPSPVSRQQDKDGFDGLLRDPQAPHQKATPPNSTQGQGASAVHENKAERAVNAADEMLGGVFGVQESDAKTGPASPSGPSGPAISFTNAAVRAKTHDSVSADNSAAAG